MRITTITNRTLRIVDNKLTFYNEVLTKKLTENSKETEEKTKILLSSIVTAYNYCHITSLYLSGRRL